MGTNLYKAVCGISNIAEIRLRLNRPLLVMTTKGERVYPTFSNIKYVISQRDIDTVLSLATNMSFYSASDEMTRGYIPVSHYRIGIGGEGVMDGTKLVNVKNISYLVIRVPHQIKNVADDIVAEIFESGEYAIAHSVLIISPTGGGKTTMLRELARISSYYFNVVVIDERYELCALSKGVTSLDIGDCEVICGTNKVLAYENCVRAMNPDIIVTDELFCEREVTVICDIIRAGVKVYASVHGDSIDVIERSKTFAPLIDNFDYAVVLSKHPIGRIVEKVWL